jgi:hypothetical protein
MDVLQRALDEAMQSLPSLFLEKLITKKLQGQGITPPKSLPAKITKHILSGAAESFKYSGGKQTGDVALTLKEDDADEITRGVDIFCETQLPKVLRDVAARVAKPILKDLESRWFDEHSLQQADLSGFRARLESRWGEGLGQLRMLLTIAREWCQEAHNRETPHETPGKKQLREILIRLFVRACQVTDEIVCLLENGFADGAMARWRTLHEIEIVAAVVSQHGEGIARRYLDHQAVESKRAMNKYLNCCAALGYKPLAQREIDAITKAYDAAINQYGEVFKSDYGWAAQHLKKKHPTFADLEADAGRAQMRSHYQMGNDNVHAGVKSMFIRLGLLDNYDGMLAGRSNGGLMEPGQNTAYTLTQISAVVCLSQPNMDDLVVAAMMRLLRDEIPKSLYKADKRLRRDDKKQKSAGEVLTG